MSTSTTPAPATANVQIGNELPTVTTTTKTEYLGFNGKVLHSTVDANGKPVRIHKIITTTSTVTCYGEDLLASASDRTAEEKFVTHAKELGSDTKDVLLNTAVGVQHALESAGDFIRTQLSSTSSENPDKTTGKEQNDFLHQASALKDVLVQKAIDVKDATVDVIKDLTSPLDEPAVIHDTHTTKTTVITNQEKK